MDRFQIVLGHYVFYSLNHEGQGSKFYKKLSKITGYFNPGACFFLNDINLPENELALDVYYNLCEKYGV